MIYTFKDNMFHGGVDRLEIFELHVDWAVPAHSTFVLADTLAVTPYTYTVCGFFRPSCIPQPDTSRRVDALSEWPMWPLAYRTVGEHETMVANFTINVGNQRAGIRWFELRRGAGGWAIYQEGTHAPGAQHRWMASIGVDGLGNIALGYSTVLKSNNPSTAVYPSLAYATRLATDPLNTLQDEAVLVAGSGSQTGSSRWGDYSAMTVDPSDDCTFWYTGEYYAATSSKSWRTRIGTFKVPGCP